MKLRKIVALTLILSLLMGMLAWAEEFDFAEEVPEAEFEEVFEVPEYAEVIESIDAPADVDQIAEDIPEAVEVTETEIEEATEDIEGVEESELSEETAAEDVPEVTGAVYALLTSNTCVYKTRALADNIGVFADQQIVLLPEGESAEALVAIRFAYDGMIYDGVVETADVIEYSAIPSETIDGEIPIVSGIDREEELMLQMTPEEWLEAHAEEFFPLKTKYHEGMLKVGSMDLGLTSKYWIKGGITPTYAFVETDSPVMMMNETTQFYVSIGGFTPSKIVYSIYSRAANAKDEYYYAEIYMKTLKDSAINFKPSMDGRIFLTVYAYDEAGNYVSFDSGIFDTAKAEEAYDPSTVYGKVKQIVNQVIYPDMDDYDMALALHDWLVRKVSYAKTISGNPSDPIYHADGALLKGVAVCQGYAEAYRMLLDEVGIPNTIVVSDSGNHAWNLVKLNGEWYHVDVTWDDPIGASASYVGYTYFALTDRQLNELKTSSHYWNEKQTSNSMVPASSKAGLKVNFTNASTLTTQLKNLNYTPARFYAYYTGTSTADQSSVIASSLRSVFPAHNSTVKRNGTIYLITLTRNDMTAEVKTYERDDPEAVTSITLPRDINIGVGESIALKMDCEPQSSADRVTFSSSNSSIVAVNAQTGLIKGAREGTATITASSFDVKATCTVTVSAAATGIALTRSAVSTCVGESFKLTCSLTGTSNALKWSSSNSEVASVTPDGIVTSENLGTAEITVRTFNGKTASCAVTVTTRATAIRLPAELTLGVGQKYTLVPKYEPENAGGVVTYTSNDPDIVTVSSAGVVTAKANGTAVITASDSYGTTCETVITVVAAPTAVWMSTTAANLGAGETITLLAQSPDYDLSGITFKSSASNVASVDLNGKVTARAAGTAVITVSTYNGKVGTCKITVQAAPSYIKLSKGYLSMGVGNSYTLAVTLPAKTCTKYSWSVDGDAVTVANNGKVYAKKVGTATVKVTTYNGKTASCTFTIVHPPQAIRVAASKVSMSKGKKYSLNGKAMPDANAGTVSYSSSNKKVCTVNSSGVITAKKPGKATITMRMYNGVTTTCKVTVVKKKRVLKVTKQKTPTIVTPMTDKSASDDKVVINDYATPKDGGIDDAELEIAGAPKTGDPRTTYVLIALMISAAFLAACLITKRKAKRR